MKNFSAIMDGLQNFFRPVRRSIVDNNYFFLCIRHLNGSHLCQNFVDGFLLVVNWNDNRKSHWIFLAISCQKVTVFSMPELESRFFTLSRAVFPNLALKPSSLNSNSNARVKESRSPIPIKIPFSPDLIKFVPPVVFVETIVHPAADACNNTCPKLSVFEGKTKISAALKISGSASNFFGPKNFILWSFPAKIFNFSSSRPLPTICNSKSNFKPFVTAINMATFFSFDNLP